MGTAEAAPLLNCCQDPAVAAALGRNPPFTIYNWFVYRL